MANFAKKKIFKLAKGFRGRAKNCFSLAVRRVHRKLRLQYRMRKLLRRNYRRDWNLSISAAVRNYQFSYSRFIYSWRNSNIKLDRKIMAELAENQPYSFKAVVQQISRQVQIPKFKPCEVSYQDALQQPEKYMFIGKGDQVTKPIEPRFQYIRLINQERDYDKDNRRVSKRALEEDLAIQKQLKKKMYTTAQMKRIPKEIIDDDWEETFDIKYKF